jgi:hypothetical protein
MRKLIDVTIHYPDGAENTWEFLRSKSTRILVRIRVLPIDDALRNQDPDDPEYRERFNRWLNRLWEEKDREIDSLAAASD